MSVLEPLQSVITADGELKRGKVEMDGHTLRVDCATDNSWVSLHDDSLGDPLAYEVLTRQDGTLHTDQPTLTCAWTAEHFAWLQGYIDPPVFVRRPAQGFVVPEVPPVQAFHPSPDPKKQKEVLILSVCYLIMGFIASQADHTLLWLLGGFMLLLGLRGLYESRTMLPALCNPQSKFVWITSATCFVLGAALALADETRTIGFAIGCVLMIYGIVKPIEYSQNHKTK